MKFQDPNMRSSNVTDGLNKSGDKSSTRPLVITSEI